MKLQGRKIVLGVTGGIASYKAAELLRLFQQEGADVRVVMTAAATRFVAPLTFRTLSGHPVLTSLFAGEDPVAGHEDESGVEHIELVKNADLVVVAPATANSLAKAAWGMADNALSTVVLAAGNEVLWAPAMNHRMWKNPVTQDNVTRLQRLGHQFVEPEEGWMACREHGPGRMAEPVTILQRVTELIGHPQDLAGTRVLVTAGRTEEALDPVRILTNRSSGRMGVALAAEALSRGAEVTLVAGPMDVPPPEGVRVERIFTAEEMAQVTARLFPECDVLVMAAAVGDFRPRSPAVQKMHREKGLIQVDLEPNPDILQNLSRKRREDQVLVGFALETENPVKAGREKLKRKGVDLIVVNNPNQPGAAIGGETNVVTLLEPGRAARRLPVLPKREVAQRILDWVATRRSKTARRGTGGDPRDELAALSAELRRRVERERERGRTHVVSPRLKELLREDAGERAPAGKRAAAASGTPSGAPRAARPPKAAASARRPSEASPPSRPRSPAPPRAASAPAGRSARGKKLPLIEVETPAPDFAERMERLEEMAKAAATCTRCALHEERTHVVFGRGRARNRVMFVGEAPGFNEDKQGVPFVGRAGQLLDQIIDAVGFQREEIYITNVLKCRPPGNRDPQPEEIAACSPYLEEQIELIQPKIICALGRFAAQFLTGKPRATMGELRGRIAYYRERFMVLPTYHPAALLRNPNLKRVVWEDVQLLRKEYLR